MEKKTQYQTHGPIAVITMANPPVNGLGYALRQSIVDDMDRALDDPEVSAIVLTGSESAFSGGADVTEFGTARARQEPGLRTVISIIEDASKPVVAAIAGSCLGGGLELAMAAHFRIATSSASLGLPEVKLGLLPGAGGTQRLPRLIGLEPALNMILSGEPRSAAAFKGTGLVDEIATGDLIPAAVAFAQTVLREQRKLKRARDLKVNAPGHEAYLRFARNTVLGRGGHFPAPLKCLEAVEASVRISFDQALQLERESFNTLMNSAASASLRHVFQAERAAAKLTGMQAGTPLRDIRAVGVVGAGTMGGGIAMNFASAGIPVVLLDSRQELLDKGLAVIRRNYENSMRKGKLSSEQVEARMALIAHTLDYGRLANVDLVIEAVFEDLEVKRQVFRKIDAIAKDGAILASNTSALDLNQIAAFTTRPADVIGLHFFSPANVMRLLEVVRGEKTSDVVLASCMRMAKQIKKVAVVSGVCDGFIGNRMLARYTAAAAHLVNIGASPHQIDKALEGFGLAMGPFRMADLAGLDIGWSIRKRRAAANPNQDFRVAADLLCEAGRFGQKTGSGWYRYEAGRREPQYDPVVDGLIDQFRQRQAFSPRAVTNPEVVERCIFALVNEAARILQEGIAQRASDIDVVYLNGYGFPLHRGGPLKYADTVGLNNVVRALRKFALEPGADPSWQPADLLVELAENGRTFN